MIVWHENKLVEVKFSRTKGLNILDNKDRPVRDYVAEDDVLNVKIVDMKARFYYESVLSNEDRLKVLSDYMNKNNLMFQDKADEFAQTGLSLVDYIYEKKSSKNSQKLSNKKFFCFVCGSPLPSAS